MKVLKLECLKRDGSEGAQGIDNNDRRRSKDLTGKTLMVGGILTVKVLEVIVTILHGAIEGLLVFAAFPY